MPDDAFNPEAQIDALAPLLGLTIASEERPAVVRFLKLARDMAGKLEAAPLPASTLELAPVFRPGASPGGADES